MESLIVAAVGKEEEERAVVNRLFWGEKNLLRVAVAYAIRKGPLFFSLSLSVHLQQLVST